MMSGRVTGSMTISRFCLSRLRNYARGPDLSIWNKPPPCQCIRIRKAQTIIAAHLYSNQHILKPRNARATRKMSTTETPLPAHFTCVRFDAVIQVSHLTGFAPAKAIRPPAWQACETKPICATRRSRFGIGDLGRRRRGMRNEPNPGGRRSVEGRKCQTKPISPPPEAATQTQKLPRAERSVNPTWQYV